MTALVDPFQQSISESERTLRALEGALIGIERQILLVDAIATQLVGISVQGISNRGTAWTIPGLIVYVTVLLGGERGIAVGTFEIAADMRFVVSSFNLEGWKACQDII